MLSSRVLAHLGMCFVMGSFGLWNVLGRLVLRQGQDPVVFALYRELPTALLLDLACLLQILFFGPWPPLPTMKEATLLLASGVFGVFALQLTFILGLKRASADEGALIVTLTPLVVVLLAAAIGVEPLELRGEAKRFGRQRLLGVLTAVAGAAMVVEGGRGKGSNSWKGGLLFLMSDLGNAVFIVFQKPLLRRYEPLFVIAVSYSVGAACMLAAAAGKDAAAFAVSTQEVVVLAFVVLVCGALDYGLMTWCNARLDAAVVGLYACLQPLVTCVVALWLLGETLSAGSFLGGLLVVQGLVIASLAERRRPAQAPGCQGPLLES